MNLQPLRVAIDARPLSMAHTGVAMYLQSVIRPLIEAGVAVTLVTNAPLRDQDEWMKHCQTVVLAGQKRWQWEQSALLKWLEANNFDVYFCGWNYGFPRHYHGRTKLLLAIHDLIPLEQPWAYLKALRGRRLSIRGWLHAGKEWMQYRLSLAISIRKADKIITISQASADSFHYYFPHRPIEPLLTRVHRLKKLVGKRLLADPYFVYLGGVDVRKNIDQLIEAFALYRQKDTRETKLVLIGKDFEQFGSQIACLGLRDQIIETGYVSNEVKFNWLAHSLALVYPSSYEGYGLPIAEAYLAGVAAITGTNPALREIGGNAALYVNPLDPAAIAQAMVEVTKSVVVEQLAVARVKQLDILCDPAIDTRRVEIFRELR